MKRYGCLPIIVLVVFCGCKPQSSPTTSEVSYSNSPDPPPQNIAGHLTTSSTPADLVIEEIDFMKIRSGHFVMGSPTTEPGHQPQEKQTFVVIPSVLWVSRTEITQTQFERIAGFNPSISQGPNYPVTMVSWEDTQDFLEKLNNRSQEYHFRLPTEAEWEYACRAGSDLPFPPTEGKQHEMETALQKWQQGDKDFLQRYLGHIGWIDQSELHPVGKLQTNNFGLHDMIGNVWEWCDSQKPTIEQPIRGGAWSSTDILGCRSAFRGFEPRDSHKDSIGFRIVAEISP